MEIQSFRFEVLGSITVQGFAKGLRYGVRAKDLGP